MAKKCRHNSVHRLKGSARLALANTRLVLVSPIGELGLSFGLIKIILAHRRRQKDADIIQFTV
jgi:hypothetical protein